MKIGIHFRSIILGVLQVVGTCAAAVGYGLLVWYPLEPSGRTGSQFLLLLFAPAIIVGLPFVIARAMLRVWSGLTRYELTAGALTVHSPTRSHTLAWSDIADFRLPAARFPKAPERLVLVDLQGRTVALPLNRLRGTAAEPIVVRSIPGLAVHGLERVHAAPAVLRSSFRTRWDLHKSTVLPLYSLIVLSLLFSVGSLLMGWEFVNYLRLQRAHATASGEVVQITKESGEHEHVWARVRYTAANGQTVVIHRSVMIPFADRYKIGDHVSVEYLPSHPPVGRIPGWDLDGREWVFMIMILPLAVITCRAAFRLSALWVRPLRESLFWAGNASARCLVLSGADLQRLYDLLPSRHAGTLALLPPPRGQNNPGPKGWANRFRRAGLQGRVVANRFVVFDSAMASRIFDRLGGEGTYKDEYFVLASEDAETIDRCLREQLPQTRFKLEVPSSPTIRFCYQRFAGGPIDENQIAVAFEDWVSARLRRLYGGEMPPEISGAHFASLFEIDPANGAYLLLIERRRPGPVIWLREMEAADAVMAECSFGRWVVTRGMPIPRSLRLRSTLMRNLRRALAPSGAGTIDVKAAQAAPQPSRISDQPG